MNYRIERINGEFRRSLSDIITNRLKDPRITEMVSVLKVDTAKDLATARVYVSIYGDKAGCDATFDALKKTAGFIRRELTAEFKDLRLVPSLTFIRDDSMEYSEKINTLLRDLNKDE